MEDINVQMHDLPTTIASFVVSNVDDSYTIILNARLTHDRLILAYQHEIAHIHNGDYNTGKNVDLIEVYAHGQ